MRIRSAAAVAVAVAVAVAAAFVTTRPSAGAPAPHKICDRVASLSGSDDAAGTLSRPFRTIRRLLAALGPGQTGCLLRGTFVEDVGIATSGRAKARITLRSAPGNHARIAGYVVFRSSARYVTLSDLDIDGRTAGPNTVQVLGDDITLRRLDITNDGKPGEAHDGICVLAGAGFENDPANTAYRLTIESSRIHNCGDDPHEHAVYLESTRGAVIRGSYLYDNPGYGVSMYPDAQGTLIVRNVIDGNGHGNITFSGEAAGAEYRFDHASSNNDVTLNVIANAGSRYNVESYFPSLRPSGNAVTLNCLWNAPWGDFGYTDGYSTRGNVHRDPQYVDRTRKDFRLRASSPCRAMGPRTAPP